MAGRGKTIVVKVGSSTLVGQGHNLDRAYLADLAAQVAAVRELGWSPIVVTSAAIACGLDALGIGQRPTDMPTLQAAASVGECVLSEAYATAFGALGITTSLVLLTRHDTADRRAYLHARDALERLVELDVVPVVNENDTTSVEQIRFGDNDTLAALVACLVKADACVIFSDVDGLYSANPATDPDAVLLHTVERIDPAVAAAAGGAGSKVGSGGMITKISAARTLMVAGIPLTVCNGREAGALVRIAEGEQVGTLFHSGRPVHEITNYKLWIALGDAAKGAVVVDDGAARALVGQGRSLLAVGVAGLRGSFESGDIVDVEDGQGALVARGKVNASSDEVQLAKGSSQQQLRANRLLAHLSDRPLIHRDEMVVFE